MVRVMCLAGVRAIPQGDEATPRCRSPTAFIYVNPHMYRGQARTL